MTSYNRNECSKFDEGKICARYAKANQRSGSRARHVEGLDIKGKDCKIKGKLQITKYKIQITK